MVCKSCQAALTDDSVYCHICGKKQISQARHRLHRGKSQGTITKLPGRRNNKFWARLPVDNNSDSNKRTSIGCFPTYNDAAEALAKAMYTQDAATVTNRTVTLQDIYDRFVESHYYATLSKSGQSAHRTAWTHLSSIAQIPVSSITKATFQHPIDELQKTGKKRETLAKVRNLCSLLCQEAMGMGLLVTNYGKLVQLPRNDSSGALPFTSVELKKIWAKADKGDSTAAAVLILNYTGMRPSELLSLEISTHIHCHGQRTYFKTGSKTDAGKNRIIPLPEILSKYVDGLIGDRNCGPLVAATGGGFYRLDNWRPRCFNKLMDELDLLGHTPYSCRHTYADLQKRRKIDPEIMMEIMGHEDFATTVEHYHTTTDEDLDRIFSAVDGISRPK